MQRNRECVKEEKYITRVIKKANLSSRNHQQARIYQLAFRSTPIKNFAAETFPLSPLLFLLKLLFLFIARIFKSTGKLICRRFNRYFTLFRSIALFLSEYLFFSVCRQIFRHLSKWPIKFDRDRAKRNHSWYFGLSKKKKRKKRNG